VGRGGAGNHQGTTSPLSPQWNPVIPGGREPRLNSEKEFVEWSRNVKRNGDKG
jgi:hypothetical protein